MPDLSRDLLLTELQTLLREAFEGPQRASAYTDAGPESGLSGTLRSPPMFPTSADLVAKLPEPHGLEGIGDQNLLRQLFEPLGRGDPPP